MKRDLKLNMDHLEETCRRIAAYSEALTKVMEAAKVFLEVLKQQESVSYETLSKEWEAGVVTKGEILQARLEKVHGILCRYIAEMEGYISPCDRTQMMRVDRNDIWWNLQQILCELQEPESICHDDGSSYPDYKHNPMTRIFYSEEEWDAMMKEEEAERIKREANYRKMKSFRTQLRHSIETSIQREWESMNRIYRNAVVEFENTDDAYQRKIEQCYNEYSTYFDDIKDNAAKMKNFVRGAWQQIVDIAKLLNTINMLTTPYTMLMYYTGKLDSKREQSIRGVHEGVRLFLTDPLSALGAMGQNAMDTLDEEGLSYAAGYVSVDLVIGVGIKKGISKAFGKVDDIAEVGAKAANKVDDAAEIGAKAAGKVDDVAEIGAKAAGKVDDVAEAGAKAVGKVDDVIEGGLKTVNTDDLKVIEIKTPEVANREWLTRGYDNPPYNLDFEIKVVQAGNEDYVRVFSYNTDGTSNKLGSWLMKRRDIEGLTPAQIADKYALPKEPTHICDINMNPNTNLQTGIANYVKGWGNGGGQQFDTMGIRLPESVFVNERLIGE